MALRKVEFNTDRSKQLNHFADRFVWVPHWGAEITMAVEGLEAQIDEVDRFAPAKAIISTMAEAGKYHFEAQSEVGDLEMAANPNTGIYPVKFERIHGDEIVLSAMARHLLFRDSLPRDKWPIHTEPHFSRKIKPYNRQVKNLSSTKRIGLWQSALESETARQNFWRGSLLTALVNPKVINAIASQKNDTEPIAEIA
jgi:hypothetical protein